MVDVHDQETRSYNMSRIRSRDTKPEILVRNFCSEKVSDINCMIKLCRANLTWFSRNIRPSYLFMVVSGTAMRDANTL
jgi:hypothetical protein